MIKAIPLSKHVQCSYPVLMDSTNNLTFSQAITFGCVQLSVFFQLQFFASILLSTHGPRRLPELR